MGVRISPGTDGVLRSNNLDMLREMRAASLTQKARLPTPTAMSAETLLQIAVVGGARAVGMADKLGNLEERFQATTPDSQPYRWEWQMTWVA